MDKVVILEKASAKAQGYAKKMREQSVFVNLDTLSPDSVHTTYDDPYAGDLEDDYPDHLRHIPTHHKEAITRAISNSWRDNPSISTSSLPETDGTHFHGNILGQITKRRLEESDDPVDKEILAKHFQSVEKGKEGEVPPSVLNNGTLQRRFLRVDKYAVNPTLTKSSASNDPATGTRRGKGDKPEEEPFLFTARGDRAKANTESKTIKEIRSDKDMDWVFRPEHSYEAQDPYYGGKHTFQHDEMFDHIGNEDEHGNITSGIHPEKAAYLARLGGDFRRWYRDFSQDLAAHVPDHRNPNATPEEKEAAERKVNAVLRMFGYAGNRTPVSMNYGMFPKVDARNRHGLLGDTDKAQTMRDAGLLGGLSKVDLSLPMQKATANGEDLANSNRKLREYTRSFLMKSASEAVDPVTGRKLDKTRFGAAVDEWMRRIYSGLGTSTSPREQDHIQGQMNSLADQLTTEDKAAGNPDPEWEGNPLQAAMWVGNKLHIANKSEHMVGKLKEELHNLKTGGELNNKNISKEGKDAYKDKLKAAINSVSNYSKLVTGGETPDGIFDMYDRWSALHTPDKLTNNNNGATVPNYKDFNGDDGKLKEYDKDAGQTAEDFLPRHISLSEQRKPPVESNGQVDFTNQPEDVGKAQVAYLPDYSVYKHIGAIKDKLHELADSGFISHSFPKLFDMKVHPILEESHKDNPERVAEIIRDSVEEYKRKKRAQGENVNFIASGKEAGEIDDEDSPEGATPDSMRHSLGVVHGLARGEVGASGMKYGDSANGRHNLVAPHPIVQDMLNHPSDYMRAGRYRKGDNGENVHDEQGEPIFDEEEMPEGIQNRLSTIAPKPENDAPTALKLGKPSTYFDAITLPHGEEALRHAVAEIDSETGEATAPTELGRHLTHIYRHEQVASELANMVKAKRNAFTGIKEGFSLLKEARENPDQEERVTQEAEAHKLIGSSVKARNKVLEAEREKGYANPLATYTTEGTARSLTYMAALANEIVGHHVPQERIKLDESLPYDYDPKQFSGVVPFRSGTLAYSSQPSGGTATYAKNRFTSKGIGTWEGDDNLSTAPINGDRRTRRRASPFIIGILVKAEGQGDSQAEDVLSASQQINEHPNCRCSLEKMGNGFRWILEPTACHDCIRKAMEFNSRNYPDPVVQDSDNTSPQSAMRQGWGKMNQQSNQEPQEMERQEGVGRGEPQPTRSLRGNWGREVGGGNSAEKLAITTPKSFPYQGASYRESRGRGRQMSKGYTAVKFKGLIKALEGEHPFGRNLAPQPSPEALKWHRAVHLGQESPPYMEGKVFTRNVNPERYDNLYNNGNNVADYKRKQLANVKYRYPAIRVQDEDLNHILDGGEYKNGFAMADETAGNVKANFPRVVTQRQQAEKRLWGHEIGQDNEKRPVYGALASTPTSGRPDEYNSEQSGTSRKMLTDWYGGTEMMFKPHRVFPHATASYGDSPFDTYVSTPVLDPHPVSGLHPSSSPADSVEVESNVEHISKNPFKEAEPIEDFTPTYDANNKEYGSQLKSPASYHEMQVHRPLNMEHDLGAVYFHDSAPKDAIQNLDKRGVKWASGNAGEEYDFKHPHLAIMAKYHDPEYNRKLDTYNNAYMDYANSEKHDTEHPQWATTFDNDKRKAKDEAGDILDNHIQGINNGSIHPEWLQQFKEHGIHPDVFKRVGEK